MFDNNDVDYLAARISTIWGLEVSPDLVVAGEDSEDIRKVALSMPLDKCTLFSLFNRYKNRTLVNGSTVGLAEIVAAMSTSMKDVNTMISVIHNDPLLSPLLLTEDIQPLMSTSIVVSERSPQVISDYIRNLEMGIRDTYYHAKGLLNILGKIMSIKAVIGGLYYGLLHRFTKEDLITEIHHLEPSSSPYYLTISKINDYIEWYDSHKRQRLQVVKEGEVPTRTDQIQFYPYSFEVLDQIEKSSSSPVYRDMQIFPPQMKTTKYIIHPTTSINAIDMISNAITSMDLPLIAGDIDGTKIIKKYNNIVPDPSWFMKIPADIVKIYIRVGKDKHQLVTYDVSENYFSLDANSKNIRIDEIVTILCHHLDARWMSIPRPYLSSWGAISNTIPVDRNVLAWLITNPPPKYAKAGIGQYLFIEESSKPSSLKDKTNIHMRLGEDKLYISTSLGKTTTGTLVYDEKWIGFEREQSYTTLSVNAAPSREYANIALNIYRHIMAMYMEYYDETLRHINAMVTHIPPNPPTFKVLVQRTPTTHDIYSHIDTKLYNYTSLISPGILPVPIDRGDADKWRSEGYAVLHLPTVVRNYPSIVIETSDDIWVRTPSPGRFIVTKKNGYHGYVPVLYTGSVNGPILEINGDVVTGVLQEPKKSRNTLSETSSLFGKLDRIGYIDTSLQQFLLPITNDRYQVYRVGSSPSIFDTLNRIGYGNITPVDVAKYAYMCKGENWTQSVT